jgi:predicted heme/steroid binding protein
MKDDAGRINEYYDGMIEGVRLYSWWRDGEQFVGTCGTTLKQAINNIEAERKEALERI